MEVFISAFYYIVLYFLSIKLDNCVHSFLSISFFYMYKPSIVCVLTILHNFSLKVSHLQTPDFRNYVCVHLVFTAGHLHHVRALKFVPFRW